jgi:hypothetical protein
MKPLRVIDRLAFLFCVLAGAALTGCNLPAGESSTPTLNVTQAYQTVEARLTEAIALTPKISPTSPALVTTSPSEPASSSTPIVQTVTPEPTQPSDEFCDQAIPGVPIDVTIPDDSKMTPGQAFTKTWRLQNAGTCTWTSEYSLVWFSGDRLEAPLNIPLTGDVSPGESVDLSVDMIAPETPGTYQSNWKLSNPSDTLFGIGPNGDASFWVRIIVEGTAPLTGTPTVTATIAPSITPTAGVKVSGPATLEIGNLYDLDTNQINNGEEDLEYQEVEGNHLLLPIDETAMILFGPIQPMLNDCLSVDLSSDAITVDNLVGNFICYRTNMALPGWALINGLDPDTGFLNIEIFTWSIP